MTQSFMMLYVKWAQGMYGIYCTEAQGRLRLRVEVSKCHTSQVHMILYPVSNYY